MSPTATTRRRATLPCSHPYWITHEAPPFGCGGPLVTSTRSSATPLSCETAGTNAEGAVDTSNHWLNAGRTNIPSVADDPAYGRSTSISRPLAETLTTTYKSEEDPNRTAVCPASIDDRASKRTAAEPDVTLAYIGTVSSVSSAPTSTNRVSSSTQHATVLALIRVTSCSTRPVLKTPASAVAETTSNSGRGDPAFSWKVTVQSRPP